ncbi:hypothetical protein PAU_01722 [Photorhabdus asymbiotica]|uniref:Uncharacterized protein n=1 Tax=Photorhabdus asymbiotica subsp. asymbiotica (strain ATCC 43949 / 3105-77) TaxID=553480 RepID=C7BTF9_PHOAA|nr:hypothetical protein PAU_01722 [Photorhabdus asymbiotica]
MPHCNNQSNILSNYKNHIQTYCLLENKLLYIPKYYIIF